MNLKKLERYLPVNLLGPGPRLIKKKNFPGRGLTKVEKHWFSALWDPQRLHISSIQCGSMHDNNFCG